ncbi:hypothetical protein BJ508DRAFT_365057 [Ascobolus immersus RN42]|uniref:Uncharacterized protein n=1 Tax=Ascobolus immersus RN42 TaxID=1160509 RepID=A0A3N4HRC0_ASCIM|nr:hypothetical protein BJ508DRAFT_365057 [Ascobolus immersus RN42]
MATSTAPTSYGTVPPSSTPERTGLLSRLNFPTVKRQRTLLSLQLLLFSTTLVSTTLFGHVVVQNGHNSYRNTLGSKVIRTLTLSFASSLVTLLYAFFTLPFLPIKLTYTHPLWRIIPQLLFGILLIIAFAVTTGYTKWFFPCGRYQDHYNHCGGRFNSRAFVAAGSILELVGGAAALTIGGIMWKGWKEGSQVEYEEVREESV